MNALDLAATALAMAGFSLGFTLGSAWTSSRAKRLDADAIAAARFLLARLDDFETQLDSQHETREFYGHLAPAMARLRMLLRNADAAA